MTTADIQPIVDSMKARIVSYELAIETLKQTGKPELEIVLYSLEQSLFNQKDQLTNYNILLSQLQEEEAKTKENPNV